MAPSVRPTWVMVGASRGNGTVMILASKTLTEAQLEVEAEIASSSWHSYERQRVLAQTITLSVVMEDFIVIYGPDWATAFNTLFREWKPDDAAPTPAVERGTSPRVVEGIVAR